ncbi:TPA: short-chain dehydrogenase [Candidatus Uhrbacteria bacterium]|nr:short-chain dehydrogenase [Candidatus Uhrbacteria bacterium]
MKTIVITGASRGIGRALAERFLAEGERVIGTSQSGTADYEHPNLIMVQLELASVESRESCTARIGELTESIDILINNAGIWQPADDKAIIDVAVLQETLEVNMIGPIDFTERVLLMVKKGGQIINLSSRRGSMAYTTADLYPCYCISKAGINMFTRLLAARLKNKITVSAVHPGVVKTEMSDWKGELTAAEAADDIYKLAMKYKETGMFWYKGEIFPW